MYHLYAPIPVTLSERIAYSFSALMEALRRHQRVSVLLAAVGLQLYMRLERCRNRVVGLMARIEAGTLRAWVLRRAGARSGARAVVMDEAARRRFGEMSRTWKGVPRRRGWLLGLIPYEAAGHASQLEAALRSDEMQALLAADPRLGQALRGTCHMLGIDVGILAGRAPEPDVVEAAEAEVPVSEPEAVCEAGGSEAALPAPIVAEKD